MKQTILYLDDDEASLDHFQKTCDADYDVRTATKSSEAYRLLSVQPAEIIISDQLMPDIQGMEFLSTVAQQFPESYRILLTGAGVVGDFVYEISHGIVHHFQTKPWSAHDVQQMFERVGVWRREQTLQAKTKELIHE